MRIIMTLLVLLTHQLAADITGYGVIEPDPRFVLNVNFSHPGQILKIYVSPGQLVKKGDSLAALLTDPTVLTIYQQDLSALNLAKQDVERTDRLAQLKLATPAQYAIAEKALVDAQAKVDVHKLLGEDNSENTFKAPFDGLVISTLVSAGDRIQAGSNVLQIAPKDRFVARVGIDPALVSVIQPGQTVTIVNLSNPNAKQESKVSDIFHRINPQTQLVDVIIPIVEPSELLPGTQIKASFTLEKAR